MKQGRKIKYTHILVGTWLKYSTYQLVPVLASNYKQHILSSAKVKKVCYSLAEFCVKSVYLDVEGHEVHETF
jgi:hypothetical protein